MDKRFNQSLTLVFIALLALSLTACTSGKAAEVDAVEQATVTPIPTEPPPTATPLPPTETPVPTATSVPTIESGETEHFMTVGEWDRSYLLYIPPGLTKEEPVPVVFAFHRYSVGTPERMRSVTGYNDMADRSRFVVVYPQGVRDSWNGGGGPGAAVLLEVDEQAFIEAILLELESIVNTDPRRIYATGVSAGGGLVYRLACDMSDTFAAIASVAGVMMYSPCEPARAVSVLHIHGLADPFVSYAGDGMFTTPPVEDVIAEWVALNSCTESTESTVQNDKYNEITHTTYSSCEDETAVDLYVIEKLGHGWPDMASETIWEFFTQHPMP